MDALIDFSWRAYPGAAVMLVGALLFARGSFAMVRAWRGSATERPLAHMTGFRLAVIGLAIAAAGAAWVWQLVWLLALALIIGGEELLESSICVYALRRAPRVTPPRAA